MSKFVKKSPELVAQDHAEAVEGLQMFYLGICLYQAAWEHRFQEALASADKFVSDAIASRERSRSMVQKFREEIECDVAHWIC